MTDSSEPKSSKRPEIWLFVLFFLFIVAAIAAMMMLDAAGEARMGNENQIKDAPRAG